MLHHSRIKAASDLSSSRTASSCSAQRRKELDQRLALAARGDGSCRPATAQVDRACRVREAACWLPLGCRIRTLAPPQCARPGYRDDVDYSLGLLRRLPRRPTRFRPPAGRVRQPGSRQEADAAVLGSPMTPQFALDDLGPHVDLRGRPESNEPGLGVSEIVRLNTAPLGTARTTKSP